MRRHLLNLLLSTLALVVIAAPGNDARAERRVALVIGNSTYQSVPRLPNTLNDANAISMLFKRAGFDTVDLRTNVGVVEFKRALREFWMTSRGADVAVVYYAGHGIEVSGTNYLIPVDAKLASDFDAEDEAVALSRIITTLESVKRLRLIILDACRENPFGSKMQRRLAVRGSTVGLAKIEEDASDTLVAYAAKAGSVSYDGDGANSPFTTALVKYIAQPGLDVGLALRKVRDDVLRATGGRQEPFVYGSLGGETIALVSAPDPAKSIVTAPPAAAVVPNVAVLPSPAPVAPPLSAEQICRRDEERLARLRSNPNRDELLRFEEELGCAPLRPQLLRLRESIVGGPAPAVSVTPAATPPSAPQERATAQVEDVCIRDGERLAKLRVERSRAAIETFQRELGCERLRPQLQRLLDSVN